MDISRTLLHIRPNCLFFVNGETYENIVWMDEKPKPSREEVEAGWEQVKNLIGWEQVREKRNKLLSESDYTQLEDFNGDKELWGIYRRTLRNIPQVYGNPESVVWPTKPL